MAIKAIVEAVETRLVALGFKATEDVFGFDDVPESVINKSFRIETRLVSSEYQSYQTANVHEEISIYIAYEASGRKRSAALKTALDDVEAVEKDIINAAAIRNLSSDPILTLDRDASTQKYFEDYLVSRIAFTADYLRDLAPA